MKPMLTMKLLIGKGPEFDNEEVRLQVLKFISEAHRKRQAFMNEAGINPINI